MKEAAISVRANAWVVVKSQDSSIAVTSCSKIARKRITMDKAAHSVSFIVESLFGGGRLLIYLYSARSPKRVLSGENISLL